MNREIRDEWTKRLRSGAIEQGTGLLRKGNKFCCLGVLCQMAVEDGVIIGREQPLTNGRWGYGNDIAMHTGGLPDEVIEWAGLPDGALNRSVLLAGGGFTLASANDAGSDFKAIAGLIEEYL